MERGEGGVLWLNLGGVGRGARPIWGKGLARSYNNVAKHNLLFRLDLGTSGRKWQAVNDHKTEQVTQCVFCGCAKFGHTE